MTIDVSPDWAESTVRFLRLTGHVPASSIRTSSDLLGRALIKQKYFYADMVKKRKFAEARWRSFLEQMASDWTEAHHKKFIKYLESGGYKPLEPTVKKPKPVHSEKLIVPTTDGYEEIELEMDDVEAAVSKESGKKSQLSPKHEMQEILATAEMQLDPRYGAW